MRLTVKLTQIQGHRPLTIKHKVMVPQITMEEVQLLLEEIKRTRNHKQVMEITKTLEEVIQVKEQQHLRQEETLQIQVTQLKEEVKRLSHL